MILFSRRARNHLRESQINANWGFIHIWSEADKWAMRTRVCLDESEVIGVLVEATIVVDPGPSQLFPKFACYRLRLIEATI